MPALTLMPESCAMLERCVRGGQKIVSSPRVCGPQGMDPRAEMRPYGMAGDTAVLAIDGPLWFSPNIFSMFWGGATTGGVSHALREALADEQVKRIVIDCHCPGGDAAGMDELADLVASAAKPVIVYAHDVLASGGYWMAAGAAAIVGTPGCRVGSIGAYSVHYDTTELAKKMGERPLVSTSGNRKILGLYGVPPDEGAWADVEKGIVDITTRFYAAVEAGRGWTREQLVAADGGIFCGPEAKANGLIDEILLPDAFWAKAMAGGWDKAKGQMANGQMARSGVSTSGPLAICDLAISPPAQSVRRESEAARVMSRQGKNTAAVSPLPTSHSPLPKTEQTMTVDEMKAAFDQMSDEDKAALKAHVAAGETEEEKPVEEPAPEEPKAKAAGAQAAALSFEQVSAMVPAKMPGRDSFIVKVLGDKCSRDQVQARITDALLERVEAKALPVAEEINAAARGGKAALGGEGRGPATGAKAAFEGAVSSVSTDRKISRAEAIRVVVKEQPAVHAAYLAELRK